MLYLLDQPLADVGLRAASDDPDAEVVLVQDGVLLSPDLDVPTYAVDADAAVRGVDLDVGIDPIGYDELVDLAFEQGVRSFV